MATTKHTALTTEELAELAENFTFNEAEPISRDEPAPKSEELFHMDKLDTDSGELPDGWTTKKYSELFGWDKTLDGMPDFDVVMYDDSVWDDEGLANIPNASDFTGRVVDHESMYPFVKSMQPKHKGMKVLLVGPTGSGKSTMAEYFCATINQPFLRIQGRADMESDSVIGKPWVSPAGGMEYLLGEWVKRTRDGWFVLVDEPWKIPNGIWMTAQRHMERGGIWQLDDMPSDDITDKQIVPKNTYRCVLADNVVGTGDNIEQYGATMIQDASTLNRIDVVIKVDYLKPEDEMKVVTGMFPAIPETQAKKMIALLNLLRTGFNSGELSSSASLRNITAWAEHAVDVQNYELGFKWVMMNRYADETEYKAVANHYFTCFNKHI